MTFVKQSLCYGRLYQLADALLLALSLKLLIHGLLKGSLSPRYAYYSVVVAFPASLVSTECECVSPPLAVGCDWRDVRSFGAALNWPERRRESASAHLARKRRRRAAFSLPHVLCEGERMQSGLLILTGN